MRRGSSAPHRVPRVVASPNPFEIIQAAPGQITIVHELKQQVRVIAVGKPYGPRY